MLRAVRRVYYTAGDGQDLSPVCARAGSAAAAEPARVVARGSPGVLRERPDRSIGPGGDHERVRGRGTRLAETKKVHLFVEQTYAHRARGIPETVAWAEFDAANDALVAVFK